MSKRTGESHEAAILHKVEKMVFSREAHVSGLSKNKRSAQKNIQTRSILRLKRLHLGICI